jgi:hypothetical protein
MVNVELNVPGDGHYPGMLGASAADEEVRVDVFVPSESVRLDGVIYHDGGARRTTPDWR